MDIRQNILEFLETVQNGNVEIYNEFSLQHELGIHLRNNLHGCKVQFERNVSHFNLPKINFEKREIDVVVFTNSEKLAAIELKYPRNGQVPETIFSFCKDILFLEQLIRAGFQSAYFLAIADDPLFYEGSNNGIYGFFRNRKIITGEITKPTGKKDHHLNIVGSYIADWMTLSGKSKYCLIEVNFSN